MKTISKLFCAVAAIASLAACNKEAANIDPVIPEGMQKMTLAVSAEPDTKVVMDVDGVGNLYWYGDEDIAVIFQGDATAYKFSASLSAKNSAAEFEGTVPEGYTENEIAAVYYPYAGEDATSYSNEIPSTQMNSGSINTATGCYKIEFPLCWINDGGSTDITLAAPANSAVLFVAKEYVKPVKMGGADVVNIRVEANSDYEADYSVVMNDDHEDLVFAINVPEGGAKLPAVLVNFREDLYFGEELSTKEFKTIEAGKRYKLSEPEYLTFRALEDNSDIVFQDYEGTAYRIFSLEEGKGEWIEDQLWGEVNQNERVQFKVADGVERGMISYNIFHAQAAHTWSGSIMSLINTDMEEDAFSCAFAACPGMRIAPKLPATKISVRSYQCMFQYCENLTVAPELPAVEVAEDCYGDMFSQCAALVEAPEVLPALKLYENCYADMFYECTSLVKTPRLPATELGNYCYMSMFSGCTSLETATELPATKATQGCYESMFENCSSLVTAPELPATELASECYAWMFYGCSSLANAPVLTADALYYRSYTGMFQKCGNINSITMLATSGINADSISAFMRDVAATGTITLKNESAKNILNNIGIIPQGWTIEIAQ